MPHLLRVLFALGLWAFTEQESLAATAISQLAVAPSTTRFCEQFPAATVEAKIAACVADLPTSGGVADATGLTGTQSISTDPFVGVTKPVLLKVGSVRYVINTNLVVPSNVTIAFSEGGLFDVPGSLPITIAA